MKTSLAESQQGWKFNAIDRCASGCNQLAFALSRFDKRCDCVPRQFHGWLTIMIFDDQVLTKARKLFKDGSNHSDEHHFSDLHERRKVTS